MGRCKALDWGEPIRCGKLRVMGDSQQWQRWQRWRGCGDRLCTGQSGLDNFTAVVDSELQGPVSGHVWSCLVMGRTLTGLDSAWFPTRPGAAFGKWRDGHVTSCSAGLAGTFAFKLWISPTWTHKNHRHTPKKSRLYARSLRRNLLGQLTGVPFGLLALSLPT